MWNGIVPNLNYPRIFGSPPYAHVPKELHKKLHPKSHKGIFIGYGDREGINGNILYDKIKRKYFTSQNVTFNEESILSILQTTTNTDSSPFMMITQINNLIQDHHIFSFRYLNHLLKIYHLTHLIKTHNQYQLMLLQI